MLGVEFRDVVQVGIGGGVGVCFGFGDRKSWGSNRLGLEINIFYLV